jgi:hypothetical protein
MRLLFIKYPITIFFFFFFFQLSIFKSPFFLIFFPSPTSFRFKAPVSPPQEGRDDLSRLVVLFPSLDPSLVHAVLAQCGSFDEASSCLSSMMSADGPSAESKQRAESDKEKQRAAQQEKEDMELALALSQSLDTMSTPSKNKGKESAKDEFLSFPPSLSLVDHDFSLDPDDDDPQKWVQDFFFFQCYLFKIGSG